MSDEAEPLLSGDEMQALLQAMRGSAAKQGAPTESLDFASEDRQLRRETKRGDRVVHETLVELRKLLRRVLGTSLVLQERPSEIVEYDLFSAAMKPGHAIAELRTAMGGEGYLTIGAGLVSYVLHRRLGADVESMDYLPPRLDLSLMDRRVLKSFFVQIVTLFSHGFCARDDAFMVTQIVSRPSDLLQRNENGSLLKMTLELAVPKLETEEINVYLSPTALRELGGPIEVPVETPAVPINPDDRRKLLDRLNMAEIDVVARLGSAQSSVRRLIDLKIGDVIRLREIPDEPLTVYVAGVPKLRGLPVSHHGNMAIKITESIKSGRNEK